MTATSDEPGDSDLNTAVVPDGAGGFDVLLRAERSAQGVGRTYTISATATAWSERGQSHRVVRRPARPGAEQVAVSVESPRRGGQDAALRLRRPVFSATVSLLVITAMALTSGQTPQEPPTAPKPQAPKGVVIRGCLTGSKLTHIEPADPSLTLPDRLRVTSIKVIRSQVKALDGHQVELVGLLRGIPGQETGLLVAESDKGKVYLGGGDPNLGQDLGSARAEPPTIHANTIKDVAPACTARPLPSRSRP